MQLIIYLSTPVNVHYRTVSVCSHDGLCRSFHSKISVFTDLYHCKRISFSGGGTASFRFNKYISVFSGLGPALEIIMYQISCFSASAYTPIMGLTEISELKRKKERKKETTPTANQHVPRPDLFHGSYTASASDSD